MIYLDYSANTPADPTVLDAFYQTERRYIGNPNSTHPAGRAAQVEMARVTDGILSAHKDKYPTRQKRTKNRIFQKKIEYFSKKPIKKQLFPKKQPKNSSYRSISDIIFRKIAFFRKIAPFMIRAFPKPPPKRAFVGTNRLFSAFLAYNPAIILYLYGQFKSN